MSGNALSGQPGPQSDEQFTSAGPPVPQRRRPGRLWALVVAVVCGAAVAALVIGLSGSSHPSAQPQHGPSPHPGQDWPTASPIPTAGNLQLAQLRAGDCLTGANMKLNTSNPWPKLTSAVPCNQPHTAEVFFADNRFWPANGSFPGSGAIAKDGAAACNSAFRSYVGIEFSKSIYTWTNIIPDASTWPSGDRGLHCIAYYSPPGHPSGATITGSIKGSRKLFIAARYARYGPAFPGRPGEGRRVRAALQPEHDRRSGGSREHADILAARDRAGINHALRAARSPIHPAGIGATCWPRTTWGRGTRSNSRSATMDAAPSTSSWLAETPPRPSRTISRGTPPARWPPRAGT